MSTAVELSTVGSSRELVHLPKLFRCWYPSEGAALPTLGGSISQQRTSRGYETMVQEPTPASHGLEEKTNRCVII